jgi:hypothetical protein
VSGQTHVPKLLTYFWVIQVDLLLVTTLALLPCYLELSDFSHYRGRDPMTLKAFIAFLLYVEHILSTCLGDNGFLSILDTLHTILCIYSVYW